MSFISLLYRQNMLKKQRKNTPQQVVMRGINSLFMEKQSDVWNLSKEDLSDEEAKLYWLGEFFPQIEGIQEQLFEGIEHGRCDT